MNRMGGGHAEGSWPEAVASCGKHAYRWLKFHPDDMTKCLSQKSGVSMGCAWCWGYPGADYSIKHCKTVCLIGKWCSHGCLTCTHQALEVQECAGASVNIPQPTFC